MSPETDALVDQLASDARPVKPLAAPLRRATASLTVAAIIILLVIAAAGDARGMAERYADQEWLMMAETGAILTTAILAILSAFILSVPGRPKMWIVAPVPSFLLWFGLSGIGCALGPGQPGLEHTTDCLTFILAASVTLAIPLLWILSRAHPIDPLPVALLGGLGAAALSAFLLQFFHPFGLTATDLAIHFGAILLILAAAALMRRALLKPA